MPNVWNSIMFGELYWLLNASRGFVSISWASFGGRVLGACCLGIRVMLNL